MEPTVPHPAGFDELQHALPEFGLRIEGRNFDRDFALVVLAADGREVLEVDAKPLRYLAMPFWRHVVITLARRAERRLARAGAP